MDLDLLQTAVPIMLRGAETTLTIGVFGAALGFPLGLLAGLARLSRQPVLSRAAGIYSALFRGTPLLVQIFVLYYGLAQISVIRHTPALWWLVGDALHCAILAVVLNTVAYTSEIFRSAFRSVPRGIVEAALACGMSPRLTFLLVRFPLALRQALPAYGNEVGSIIKESSLASTITVLEITGYAKRLMSDTFAVIEVFVIASVFYLVINVAAFALIRLLERRLAGPRQHLARRRPGFVGRKAPSRV